MTKDEIRDWQALSRKDPPGLATRPGHTYGYVWFRKPRGMAYPVIYDRRMVDIWLSCSSK